MVQARIGIEALASYLVNVETTMVNRYTKIISNRGTAIFRTDLRTNREQ